MRVSRIVLRKIMELYILLGLVVVALFALKAWASSLNHKRKIFKNNTYAYIAKDIPMTRVEAEFFVKLSRTVEERYYVFPQMHLSAILQSNVSVNDENYAFRHINGKSVDYVLCDKQTLRPTYAIELDDYTHNQAARRKRDAEVERIFKEADLPLVRFKNKDVSEAAIIQSLKNAIR